MKHCAYFSSEDTGCNNHERDMSSCLVEDDEGCPFFSPLSTTRDPLSGYYDAGGIEVIDVIEAKLPKEWLMGYYLGNCMKYALRMPWKGVPLRDAQKLRNYSKYLCEMMEAEDNEKVN